MIHRMDPAADPDREPMPERIVPMLARAGALPRDDGDWAYELKWDGVRAIAYCEPGRLRFESRNLNDIGASYPELARLNRALSSHAAVLDGEIVAFDDGRPPELRARCSRGCTSARRRARGASPSRRPVTYVIFDLLWLDGHSLMARPYDERRARARGARAERRALADAAGARRPAAREVARGEPRARGSRASSPSGATAATSRDAAAAPGSRSRTSRAQELVDRRLDRAARAAARERIGALLVGVARRGRRAALRRPRRHRLQRARARRAGGAARAARARGARRSRAGGAQPPRGAHFCEPRLVAEVEFREWTRDGLLRAAVVPGPARGRRRAVAREPAGLVIERPAARRRSRRASDGRELTLSNLDKVLYPAAGFTKRQVIELLRARSRRCCCRTSPAAR